MHEENCFITLTYNNENLPPGHSLNLSHFQNFMKRYRKFLWKNHRQKISFFHCGEYGTKLGRPHYHACIFGHDFADKKIHSNHNGNTLYTSQILEKDLWKMGYCLIGEVSFKSAAYVARYITKKINGPAQHEHYIKIDDYGEAHFVDKEYCTMSRNPAIGKRWIDKYYSDVYPSDEVIINGKSTKPPRFYDKQLEKNQPTIFKNIKLKRKKENQGNKKDQTPERLETRKTVKLAQIKSLTRNYENDS